MTLFGDYEPLLQFNVWYATWFYEMLILLGVAFIIWLPFKIFIDIKLIFQRAKNKRMEEFKAMIVKYSKGLVMVVLLAMSIAVMLIAILDFQQFPVSSTGILIVDIGVFLFIYYLLYKCKYKWLKKKFAI